MKINFRKLASLQALLERYDLQENGFVTPPDSLTEEEKADIVYGEIDMPLNKWCPCLISKSTNVPFLWCHPGLGWSPIPKEHVTTQIVRLKIEYEEAKDTCQSTIG